MALLHILEFPDPRLRKFARKVEQVDASIQQLVDDMLETMYASPLSGIGLAATQVNVQLQVVVMDLSEEHTSPQVFINPQIEVLSDEEMEYTEGCLSLPGIYDKITRPGKVRVKALNRDGEPFEVVVEGLAAVCIQHERDHLDGKLFVDYLSPLKRDRIRKKLLKQQRQRA